MSEFLTHELNDNSSSSRRVFRVGALGCRTLQFSFGTSFFIGLQFPQLHRSLQVQLSSSL